MARPRVFVSSTFYDLKYVRSSLEIFISSLGFDAVLFEKGDITFHPDAALDESCYREAASADIFVLIVGGRYGSAASASTTKIESYESITRKEFETAQNADVPTFILVESAVNSEFQTFLKNKENSSIEYAHVDSINVFNMLEGIYERRRNNPVFSFSKPNEIEAWLREQWAGLFRELLKQRSQQRQLAALNSQVSELQSINTTLKNYLEVVLNKISPDASANIIKDEENKLKIERQSRLLATSDIYQYFAENTNNDGVSRMIIEAPDNQDELFVLIDSSFPEKDISKRISTSLRHSRIAQRDYNTARAIMGLGPIEFETKSGVKSNSTNRKTRDIEK